MKTVVAPQVGKVIQDLLKLSDDTDLDILNRSMEVMVDQFQNELLPVAAQLTARLVRVFGFWFCLACRLKWLSVRIVYPTSEGNSQSRRCFECG